MSQKKKTIVIREVRDGLCMQGPVKIWRASGINDKGREFWLPDQRYDVAYPLDASTEKQLRGLIAKQYPGHPIEVRSQQ